MDDWLKKISLYKQLVFPMLIVSLLGLAAVLYSAFILERSITALEKIHREGDRKITALEDISASMTLYRAIILNHLASESAASMAKAEARLAKTRANIDSHLLIISSDNQDVHQEIQEKIRAFSKSLLYYFEKMEEIRKLSADFEKELAFDLMAKIESNIHSKIISDIRVLKAHEAADFTISRENLVSAVHRNLLVTIGIGLSGGSFLLIIAFMVTRRTTQRLSLLLGWSKEVSQGNWSQPLVTNSNDEVGKLTSAMEDMRRNIQSAHGELARSKIKAEHVADTLKIYANAFEKSGEPILISDKQNNIININKAFSEQTGYSRNEVIGKNPRIFASDKTPKSTYEEMWQALIKKSFWQGELWDRKKSGHIFPKLAAISAIRNDKNEIIFYIASFADISEQKASEARIAHLAHHDILTGLQNRFSLEDRLEQSLTIANRDQSLVALFFIDLDRFKNINDSLGHHVGDKLLIEVANRLKQCVRESDIVARIGGDEFVIVLTGMQDTTQAAVIAESLLKDVSKPYTIDQHTLETSPSIGISIYPDDGPNVDELMRNADIAMYHAKEQGRNNYHFFTESMLITAHEKLKFESELRAALENDQLELHYQPQMHVAEKCISAVEALIRWKHPQRGFIPPVEFIPLAEETGVIYELGEWILDEACHQLAAWKKAGIDNLRMSINLSAKQLHSKNLSKIVSKTLAKHHLPSSDLELEITETAAMIDPELAVQQLGALRKLGLGLAIDDFGTGYSSLAYLKRLPIQTLKLDKDFVRDIEHDQNDLEISRATISLAHNLGLKVVAEGVETEGQFEFLVDHQCDYLQGYLLSKPLPADEARKYLIEKRSCALKATSTNRSHQATI